MSDQTSPNQPSQNSSADGQVQTDAFENDLKRGIELREAGYTDESLHLLESIVDDRTKLHGREGFSIQCAISQLGRTLRAMKRFDDALKLHREVLATREELYGSVDKRTRNSAQILADTLAAAGNHAEAELVLARCTTSLAAPTWMKEARRDLNQTLDAAQWCCSCFGTGRQITQKEHTVVSEKPCTMCNGKGTILVCHIEPIATSPSQPTVSNAESMKLLSQWNSKLSELARHDPIEVKTIHRKQPKDNGMLAG